MPQWGLTSDLRREEPWDLPEGVLAPAKVITDPVHGDIYLNRLEQALIDSPPFQRLRRVRQLGTTHLVYPGATHTRFSHALGSLRVVQDLLDVVLTRSDGPHGRDNLFDHWRDNEPDANRKIAEAIVAARLGALLHDLGHVAYGHSIEDDLGILIAHDKNAGRYRHFWQQLSAQPCIDERTGARHRLGTLLGGRLKQELRPLILSKEKDIPPEDRMEYPFVADMVGNTICADLLDYLRRDHLFTGLPLALGRRFMVGFYVVPDSEGALYPQRLALTIHREGRERSDIATELLKHLRYRYELQERVLVHHAKLAADAMVGKMLELYHDLLWAREAQVRLTKDDDPPVDSRDLSEIEETVVHELGVHVPNEIERGVRGDLDDLFRRLGDDGILEFLLDQHAKHREFPRIDLARDPRAVGVATLADDLLNRRLFKVAARVTGAHAARDLHGKYKSARDRRDLERDAAGYAEIDEGWKVVIWVPQPEMRLKTAEVLVDHGSGVAPFVEYSEKGSDIYRDHKDLWTITVFVHHSVSERQKREVLARLAERMGVCWDAYERELGPDPEEWPHRLAAFDACGEWEVTAEVKELLKTGRELGARSDYSRHAQLRRRYKELLRRQRRRRKRGA
jgi:HD superfamily phosphohydrolase